jgi:D-alanine-D-alanine ligase
VDFPAGDSLSLAPVIEVTDMPSASSFGVRLVEHEADLEPAVRQALELDDRVLVEEVLHGREIDIAVLDDPDEGRRTGPPLEIQVPGLFDTAVKYDGSAKFLIPAPLADTELKALEDAALRVYEALGCRGLARVDFFLTADGLVLNEVNTMPGMTSESQVPKMFKAAGLSYSDLLDKLVRGAVR